MIVFKVYHDRMDNLIDNVDGKNFTRQSHGLLTLGVKSDTDIIANLTFKSNFLLCECIQRWKLDLAH